MTKCEKQVLIKQYADEVLDIQKRLKQISDRFNNDCEHSGRGIIGDYDSIDYTDSIMESKRDMDWIVEELDYLIWTLNWLPHKLDYDSIIDAFADIE